MKNIVLIGMPGCGKSTIGVLLAKSMLMNFIDTDLILQRNYSSSLCEIIEKYGIEKFIDIENMTLSGTSFCNSVIATGGSAVYGENAMINLSKNGIIVYLKTPVEELKKRLNNIKTRGVVIRKGATLDDLFVERAPLYDKYADITLQCDNLTAEECVERIVNEVKTFSKK